MLPCIKAPILANASSADSMLCIEMCKSAASAEEALNEPRAALSGVWGGAADICGENGGEAAFLLA